MPSLIILVVVGGLVITVLAFVNKVADTNAAEGDGI
jgi:hypothetical protein